MTTGLLLGALQGVLEWLPVSSEGVLTALSGLLLHQPLAEAIRYALWLHLGTAVSATAYFHGDILSLVRHDLLRRRPTPLAWFLLVATLVTGAVGVPIYLALEGLSGRAGAAGMLGVGLLMLLTALVARLRPAPGSRGRGQLGLVDALSAGVAQGLAILPGLSRSGLTVAVLLARDMAPREALALSFLMSIPASLGAGLLAGARGGSFLSPEGLVAMLASALVGLVAIRLLLAVAHRFNFSLFVAVVAFLIVAGAVAQLLAG